MPMIGIRIQQRGDGNDDFTNHDSYWGWDEYGSNAPIMCVWRNGQRFLEVGKQYMGREIVKIVRSASYWWVYARNVEDADDPAAQRGPEEE